MIRTGFLFLLLSAIFSSCGKPGTSQNKETEMQADSLTVQEIFPDTNCVVIDTIWE